MPVLRLHLDEQAIDIVTDDDLDAVRADIRRAAHRLDVSEYRTTAGHPVTVNWRAVRALQIELVDEHQAAGGDPPR
ncbi:hypothetical protein [Candidatus Frankia alpina]|uniref:Uncharacterized protein n=1 Tax=Candidatus Frankia alpina TaxID=2699483 RepID=A0A4S5ESG5_9ACTN|nr:hypothetical protein [Candidatus Frankia alpina]THJ75378.1 hypothetical protein E7Y31_05770 [Candidatus Frankia alpina]